ncbi:uncharacterized protein LOC124887142 [Capsicum annuum]|uniref:uncharacterized protein LOC124887142 n=1 Tax=Capsicum annuum TaxID=4072 RepID=UPI001FB06060|nr:uncharacterized protein LOC124887142 [Capsicum annuum]
MAPFETLYGKRCRSLIGWYEMDETWLFGPDLIHQAMDKVEIIRERLKTAKSRQKSYADVRRRELEFEKCIGDHSLVFPVQEVNVKESLSYEEEPIAILDCQVRKLSSNEIGSFKVIWKNQKKEEAN